MPKEPKFIGTIAYSKQDIAGVPLYTDKKAELTIEEMLEELEKSEIRDARKDELLMKLRIRVAEIGKGGKTPAPAGGVESLDHIVEGNDILRTGEGLGMFTFKQALQVVAAKRGTVPQGAQVGGVQPAATENVADLITALTPLLNKGSDVNTLKELQTAQLALMEQRILSHIPQPVQASQPKSLLDQLTELKALGPMLRSILGFPEGANNPGNTSLPVQLAGPDGKPVIMDLGQVMNWQGFQGEQKRANERHQSLMGLVQTVKENIPDGIQALRMAAQEAQKAGVSSPAKPEEAPPQTFACSCGMKFSPPAGWAGQALKCPNTACGKEYSKEELLA